MVRPDTERSVSAVASVTSAPRSVPLNRFAGERPQSLGLAHCISPQAHLGCEAGKGFTLAETKPDVVAMAKSLRRKGPKRGQRSLRAIAAERWQPPAT
jgi:hypothetical protein